MATCVNKTNTEEKKTFSWGNEPWEPLFRCRCNQKYEWNMAEPRWTLKNSVKKSKERVRLPLWGTSQIPATLCSDHYDWMVGPCCWTSDLCCCLLTLPALMVMPWSQFIFRLLQSKRELQENKPNIVCLTKSYVQPAYLWWQDKVGLFQTISALACF